MIEVLNQIKELDQIIENAIESKELAIASVIDSFVRSNYDVCCESVAMSVDKICDNYLSRAEVYELSRSQFGEIITKLDYITESKTYGYVNDIKPLDHIDDFIGGDYLPTSDTKRKTNFSEFYNDYKDFLGSSPLDYPSEFNVNAMLTNRGYTNDMLFIYGMKRASIVEDFIYDCFDIIPVYNNSPSTMIPFECVIVAFHKWLSANELGDSPLLSEIRKGISGIDGIYEMSNKHLIGYIGIAPKK
ncbi:hypothetical protein N9137_03215 [Pseudomonadales bacterium]|nr:hypothetical protein [Pseudomonadales bacterium]